ncbi:MAG TPA: Nif11-like leader peptide family natural product precursor [Mycobacteriales bacterium]|nr:Nif11-like leader peptide family natural product precursor [Mycobacteriales bacterium]
MSVQSCTTFLREAYGSTSIARQLKAMTGAGELVQLGRRHGYTFDIEDLAKASSTFSRPADAASPPAPDPAPVADATFYHYEYKLADVPALAPVLAELPRLRVSPPSVDLAEFDRSFREEDLRSTSQSPADPEFQRWHRGMAAAGWRDPDAGPDAPRRDFHLVNLDEHVDHPDYDGYFDAKVRTVAALEQVFGSEVRFSGSMWYPPRSYRLWHTNETQPGWRMYVIDLDADFAGPADTSFFRYMNPHTGELVTLRESRRIVRFFKAEQDPDRLFWHCIVNPTARHRWSFGFVVPEHWMDRIR